MSMSDKIKNSNPHAASVLDDQRPSTASQRAAAVFFRFRYPFVLLSLLVLAFFATQLGGLKINASFDDMTSPATPSA